MRGLILFYFCCLACFCFAQVSNTAVLEKKEKVSALFSADNGDGTFTNPVIHADYPDPDIIRVGQDYYMVSSSFVAMPGIPICHSKDLINWEIIGHAYDSLTLSNDYRMHNERTAYGGISWAPTIKYDEETFYIGVNSPGNGYIMFKSNRPEGPYTMHLFGTQLYDPGMFIDKDGKKYVSHGVNTIRLTELNEEGTGVKVKGDPGKEILKAPKGYDSLFEGCHMYHKDGWYYIFNPALGYDGVQMVSKSKNLYGPYETKVLINDDVNYAGAGVHQGGMIDTDQGEWWAYTFQDRDYMGRDLMLYPMRWVDDWPVVGEKGKETMGGVTFRKPRVSSKGNKFMFPQGSDDFSDPILKPIWEWNHVPLKDRWSLTERNGFLRLKSNYGRFYKVARNSLTQKVCGPSGSATVKLDVSALKRGDFAGIGVFGGPYALIGVKVRDDGSRWIEMREQETRKNQSLPEILQDSILLQDNILYLRTQVTKEGTCFMEYGYDGVSFLRLGTEPSPNFSGFLGIRYTLFCYNTQKNSPCGHADFACFDLKCSRRGNHYNGNEWVDFSQYDTRSGVALERPISKRPMQNIILTEDEGVIGFNHIECKDSPKRVFLRVKSSTDTNVVEIRANSATGKVLAICTLSATQGDRWEEQCFPIKKGVKGNKLFFVIKGNKKGVSMKSFKLSL